MTCYATVPVTRLARGSQFPALLAFRYIRTLDGYHLVNKIHNVRLCLTRRRLPLRGSRAMQRVASTGTMY